ncbi:endonuclease [Rhodobacteraceae bacterium CCMM004]|nr:endonuclease [Rhodobacteraceae bacterium CCMM004]
MSKQSQGSMTIVGVIAAGVFVVAFVALMVVGDYRFSPALFLALIAAAVAAVALFVGFHRAPADKLAPRETALKTPGSAPKPGDVDVNRTPHGSGGGSAASAAHAATTPSAMAAEAEAEGGVPKVAPVPTPDPVGAAPMPMDAADDDHAATTPSAMAAEAEAGGGVPEVATAPAADPETAAPMAMDGHAAEGHKPATLDAPRDGEADDLKKIKGVGPKLEEMLNGMGFYHFDQIAGWTADEVAWVDQNLEGFKGRVSRDDWVAQARTLSAGDETAFSEKVGKGDVY